MNIKEYWSPRLFLWESFATKAHYSPLEICRIPDGIALVGKVGLPN